jgi:hypothetical protein
MVKRPTSTLGAPVRTNLRRSPASRSSTPLPPGTDLSKVFNVAAKMLSANRSALNQADNLNQNHGDNMVQVFNTISRAMARQRGAPPSEQLRYASEYLAQNANNGSAHVYSQGLAQAARQFEGQQALTPNNILMLLQALLAGGQQLSPQGQGYNDPLSSLLGGQSGQQAGGLDLAPLLSAGMTFMSAKQQGQDNVQAALSALMNAGPMAQRGYRQQSGQLVGNALLQAIASMARRK